MFATVIPLLIYWLVFFVACYTICEMFQDWFYDEVTPKVGLKVAGGSLILALLATWLRPSFETMFTMDIAWTVLQGIVWFLVFMFILQFHPQHAAMLGITAMVLVTGLATLGVENITKPRGTIAPVRARPNNEPIRKSFSAVPTPAPIRAPGK